MKKKIIFSSIFFVIAIALVVVTFFNFVLICGDWECKRGEDDIITASFDIFGGAKQTVEDETEIREHKGTYKFNGKSIVFSAEILGIEVKETYQCTVSENKLTVSGTKYEFKRTGFSLAWIVRIVGGVFLLLGIVILIIPSKKKKASAAPEGAFVPPYGAVPYPPKGYAAAPVYTPPVYEAPAPAPAYEAPAPAPVYEAPAPAPAYEAPAPAPAYEAPAPAPVYEAPAPAPMYEAPAPAPAYEAPAPAPAYEAPAPALDATSEFIFGDVKAAEPTTSEAPAFIFETNPTAESAPAPVYEAPAAEPAPAPVYEAPAAEPAPAPVYEAPAAEPMPTYVYESPSAPSYEAPAASAPSRLKSTMGGTRTAPAASAEPAYAPSPYPTPSYDPAPYPPTYGGYTASAPEPAPYPPTYGGYTASAPEPAPYPPTYGGYTASAPEPAPYPPTYGGYTAPAPEPAPTPARSRIKSTMGSVKPTSSPYGYPDRNGDK